MEKELLNYMLFLNELDISFFSQNSYQFTIVLMFLGTFMGGFFIDFVTNLQETINYKKMINKGLEIVVGEEGEENVLEKFKTYRKTSFACLIGFIISVFATYYSIIQINEHIKEQVILEAKRQNIYNYPLFQKTIKSIEDNHRGFYSISSFADIIKMDKSFQKMMSEVEKEGKIIEQNNKIKNAIEKINECSNK